MSDLASQESVGWAFGLGSPPTPEQLKEFRRRDLRNLLTSYADEADVFAEENQNAIDSVFTALRRKRYSSGETPTIHIFIGRRGGDDTHYYAVYDNGLGMEPEIAQNFTTPGYSAAKSKGKTVGYKGVGASFFVAASEKFAVWSRGASGAETQYTVHGSHSWLTKESEPPPQVTDTAEIPEYIRKSMGSGPGTLVCYYFHPGIKPKSLANVVTMDPSASVELSRWAGYLCAKTALGRLADAADAKVEVFIHLDRGQGEVCSEKWTFGPFSLADRQLGYPYPHRVLKIAHDITKIDSLSQPKRDAMQRTLQAVRLKWSSEEITKNIDEFNFNTEEQRDLVEQHLDFIDVFFGYSSSVLKEVTTRLGTRSAVVRYGIRVGVDNVPQGRMLEFSFTSNIGLERQMHAVVAFKTLELDLGRKIPSDEVVTEVVRVLTNRAQSILKDYRIYLRKDAKGEGGPAADLAEWRKITQERESSSIVKMMFEAQGKFPALSVDPDNESDTIALCSGMLCLNILKGLSLRSLSGINQYDGLIDIDVEADTLFSPSDPLAINSKEPERGGKLKVLEFKWRFDELLRDFDEQVKNPQDIDLAIAWDIEQLSPQRGTISYWYGECEGYREIYGATHVWRDDNGATDIPIISLKHAVAIVLAQSEQQAGEPGVGVATLKLLEDAAKLAAI